MACVPRCPPARAPAIHAQLRYRLQASRATKAQHSASRTRCSALLPASAAEKRSAWQTSHDQHTDLRPASSAFGSASCALTCPAQHNDPATCLSPHRRRATTHAWCRHNNNNNNSAPFALKRASSRRRGLSRLHPAFPLTTVRVSAPLESQEISPVPPSSPVSHLHTSLLLPPQLFHNHIADHR